MAPSPFVEAAVHRWANRLDRVFDRIDRCDVVVEVPHRHHQQGRLFHVRIELKVPHQTLVVSHDCGIDHAHENVYVAIAAAFRAARRQLQDHVQMRRGNVKLHA